MASLAIGAATFNDWGGVWATLSSLRLHHDTSNVELIICDNFGCRHTKNLCKDFGVRYSLENRIQGTAFPRQRLFEIAESDWVCCIDSHVLLATGAVARMQAMIDADSGSNDLFQGPILFDQGVVCTHWKNVWDDGMWGKWVCDPRGEDPEAEPFEIPMTGLGLFLSRKEAFAGFNTHFRGFGGEEGYIHKKTKMRGDKTMCLPWLRWTHRFTPKGEATVYRNVTEDRILNYFHGFLELGMDTAPIHAHFSSQGMSKTALNRLESIALSKT